MDGTPPLIIDGSFGEGGGQILRTSLALSMMTGQPCTITDIRAGRSRPGLRPQHLAAVRGGARICGAEVEGDEPGSDRVTFRPGPIRSGEYVLDIGTAGSITLLLQTLIPPLLMGDGPSTLRLTGGTDVPGAPPADHLIHVLLPLLHRMGLTVRVDLVQRGFAPAGGGEMTVEILPGPAGFTEFLSGVPGSDTGDPSSPYHDPAAGFTSLRRCAVAISGSVFINGLPHHIALRMREAALEVFHAEFGPDTRVDIGIASGRESSGGGGRAGSGGEHPGTGITLWQGGLGASALGSKGVRAEDVGRDAARGLAGEIRAGCGVDIHTADQLPVFAPLVAMPQAGMRMRYSVREISGHLRTVLWVLERFGYPSTTLYHDGGFHIMI